MTKIYSKVALILVVTGLLTMPAVDWHCVEEIYYLKSFLPEQFMVEATFYASGIELVKITIISLPLFLMMATDAPTK